MHGLFEDIDYSEYVKKPGGRETEESARKDPSGHVPPYGYEDYVSDAPALRRVIEDSKQTLYGGKIFDYKDTYGNPLVGFAAEKKEAGDEQIREHIAGCFAAGGTWIMPSTRQVTLDQKLDVCLFPLQTGEMSVRRAVAENGTLRRLLQDDRAFLLKLLLLTAEYWQNNTKRIPLAFCPDTVFVSEQNGSLSVRILPIWSAVGKPPAELPNDGIMDASGDAYAAVLLAHEAAYGLFKSDGAMLPHMGDVDSIFVRAILPFPEFRPKLEKLIEALSERPAPAVSDTGRRAKAEYVECSEDPIAGRKIDSAEDLKERFLAWWQQLRKSGDRNKEARSEDRKRTFKHF